METIPFIFVLANITQCKTLSAGAYRLEVFKR